MTQQMHAALNGQLNTLKLESQRRRDSHKVVANRYQVDLTVVQEANAVLNSQIESLKVESQRHRDSENEVKADLRRSLEGLRRIVDDLRAQLSLQDAGVPLEVHDEATNRINEQDKMIVNLTRQATTLAARFKKKNLVGLHLLIHIVWMIDVFVCRPNLKRNSWDP